MKKRFFRIIAVILAIAFVLPGQIAEVKADTIVKQSETVQYEYDTSTKTLTVTGEGTVCQMDGWKEYKASVEKIVIGNGITEIANNAFIDCVQLEDLILPVGLVTIGANAFACDYVHTGGAHEYNTDLKELTIPSTVKTIGNEAFSYMRRLKKVNLPEGLETIGERAFTLCEKLEECKIPSTVKSIGSSAFFPCSSLTELVLPEGLEKIGENAFNDSTLYGKSKIQRVILPSTLTEMGSRAFAEEILLLCNNAYQVQYCQKNGYPYGDISNGLDINDTIMSFPESTFPGRDDYGFVYTGSEIRPKISLAYLFENGGWELLEENVHYTVSFANNINYGIATATVKGIGMYKGERSLDFYVYKPTKGDWDVSLEYESVLYDGTKKTPAVTVRDGEATLVEGRDYGVKYENNVDEGWATVTVTGKGGYVVTETKKFEIYKGELKDCTITLEYMQTVYDGKEKKPAVTVRDKAGKKLKRSTDYELTYGGTMMFPGNVIRAGRATIKVQGIGSYKGVRTLDYVIQPASIETAKVTLDKTTFAYDGSEKRPLAVVKLGGKVLTRFQEYTLIYKNNIEVGTAQAIIEGVGNYTGKIYLNFTIVPYGELPDDVKKDPGSVKKDPDSVQKEKNTMTSKNLIYTITNQEKGEVEVAGVSKKNVSKLVVPATITAGGKKYKVTSIGKKAFYKNTKIKAIVIGKNVTGIKGYAFYGCKKLKTITIKANGVVGISNNAIKGISKKAVIKVPKKLVKKYKKKLKSKTGFKKTMKIKKK